MKNAIIIYIIGIITYWLGVFILFFTAKKNWNNVDENLVDTTIIRRSKTSRILLLIAKSLIPVVNFSAGFGYISNTSYFTRK